MTPDELAQLCHHHLVLWESSVSDTPSTPSWSGTSEHYKLKFTDLVTTLLQMPELRPETAHNEWAEEMRRDGWEHGPFFDHLLRTCPYVTDYTKIPEHAWYVNDIIYRTVRDVQGIDFASAIPDGVVPFEFPDSKVLRYYPPVPRVVTPPIKKPRTKKERSYYIEPKDSLGTHAYACYKRAFTAASKIDKFGLLPWGKLLKETQVRICNFIDMYHHTKQLPTEEQLFEEVFSGTDAVMFVRDRVDVPENIRTLVSVFRKCFIQEWCG